MEGYIFRVVSRKYRGKSYFKYQMALSNIVMDEFKARGSVIPVEISVVNDGILITKLDNIDDMGKEGKREIVVGVV